MITQLLGFLVSIGKQILPKQPDLQLKVFCQINQINVDRMKSCQIALCLPHTTYGSTLSCFCKSSNTFYQPPKLLCPYPATVFSQLFGYQPTHVQLTMLCYTKVRNKVVLMLKTAG